MPSGSQRFRCRFCDRIYRPEPCHQWVPDEVRKQAVKLYLEGTHSRRIGRILGVVHQSVANWINAYQSSLPAAAAAVQHPQTLEVDELFITDALAPYV